MSREYYDQLNFRDRVPSWDWGVVAADQAKEEALALRPYKAAASEAMAVPAMIRSWERRSSQFEKDPEWVIDEQMEADIRLDHTQEEFKYITNSFSEEEMLARRSDVAEDRERLSTMASGGWQSQLAFLAFSIVDPPSVLLSLGTSGLSVVKNAVGAKRVAALAGITGLENVALDSLLMQGNTQREVSDLLVSFAAGAVIGGGIGAATRGRNPKLAHQVDEADAALRADVQRNIEQKFVDQHGVDNAPFNRRFPDADMKAMEAELDAHRMTLEEGTQGTLTKGQRSQINKQIRELETRISAEDAKIGIRQGEILPEHAKILDLEAKYIDDAKVVQARVEGGFRRTIKDQEAKVAKAEEAWTKVPDQKRAARLFKQESKLDDLKAKMQTKVDDALKKLKGKVDVKKAKLSKKVTERSKDFNKAKKPLEREITALKGKLDAADIARERSNKYRAWSKLSDEEKFADLYQGRQYPTRRQVAEEQIENLDRPTEGVRSGGAAAFGDPTMHNIHEVSRAEGMKVGELTARGASVPNALRGSMLKGKSMFTRSLHSAQNILSNSQNYAIRGLAYDIVDAPQGGPSNPFTVASRVSNTGTLIRTAMRNRLHEGLREWGKESGLTTFQATCSPRHFNQYWKEVMIERQHPGTFDSVGVKKGAAGVGDQFTLAGQIRKDAGEAGFENLELKDNYITIIFNNTAIKNALNRNSPQKIANLISKGYQNGKYKLHPKLADHIGEAYVHRARHPNLTMRDSVMATSGKDADKIAEDLLSAGVERNIVEDFLNTSAEKSRMEHISNRAKRSFEPDLRTEYQDLKLIDFVDSDVPKLLESYTREASAGSAFAKIGYKTRKEVDETISAVEKAAFNNRPGISQAGDEQYFREIAQEIQILRDVVDMAYGRSINPYAGSPWIRNLGRIRDFTGLVRLQFVGAASIPELGRITAKRSIDSVLEAIPDVGAFMGTKNVRKGGKYSGEFERPDLAELERAFGYNGEDHVLFNETLRSDALEEYGTGRLGKIVDLALSKGRRVQEITSGFRTIQSTGEKIALRSLANDIKKWAGGSGKKLSQADIDRAGWQDGFLDELKDFMQKNPKTDTFNGTDFTLFNFEKMTPNMQERLQIGVNRIVMSDMQRPFVGETPTWMHKWLGQTATQFRSFSYLSIEKQLVGDLKHDKAMAALIAMHSAMYAYMAMGVSSMQRNIGREDAMERIEKDMFGPGAIFGTVNRIGQLAGAGIGVDFLATAGVLPDSLMQDRDQAGARAFTASSVPVVGMAADALQAVKAVPDFLKGNADASKTIKEIQDITPFGKTIGINQGFNVLKQSKFKLYE